MAHQKMSDVINIPNAEGLQINYVHSGSSADMLILEVRLFSPLSQHASSSHCSPLLALMQAANPLYTLSPHSLILFNHRHAA